MYSTCLLRCDAMNDPQLRVVVLGHSGEAQQQLCHALDELGANTLAVGDFGQLDPNQMREQQPDVWLVSVDENTDASVLEPWQPLFDDPDATVVFDDADVTRRLSGWDLARWARHLAAKVLGRDNVLPPVSEDAERLPQSSASAPGHLELSLVDDADAAAYGGDPAPANALTKNASLVSMEHSGLALVDDTDAVFDGDAAPASSVSDSAPIKEQEHGGLALVDDAEFAALSASFAAERDQVAAPRVNAEPAISLDDLLRAQSADSDASDADAGTGSDADKAGSASKKDSSALSSLSLMDMAEDHSAPRKAAASKPAMSFDISGLSLQSMDGNADSGTTASASLAAAAEVPSQAPAAVVQADGLIAIIAGLGGPDAVRQFLGALPSTLPVPVLLWQHLDAGKHDRLAQQLAKASKLPVYLAKAGDAAQVGAVGVIGAGVVTVNDNGLRFAAGTGGASQGLASSLNDPATVIVVLSGAEAAIVDPARAHHEHGGKLLVQTPATCFDATAANALDGNGATVALPAELAAFATTRWAG